ncbi:hypothetical protein ZWY2020_028752, partial [Hordeum vulgare]
MRRFLVDRASTENVNGVQPEVEVEAQPPPNIANEFNPNDIERDPEKRKQISDCSSIHDFFEYISLIVTTTTTSCKRRDALAEAQHQDILDRLESGDICTGRGLHQLTTLARPGDTRW